MTPLPPLPESFRKIRVESFDGTRFMAEYVPVFTFEQMTEYAQQCAKAALLLAAELCDKDAEAIWEGPDESVPGYQELLVLRDKLRAEAEKL